MKLIECVPNFSEGLDSKIINAICDSVKSCNVNVLDVDSGKDTNRTVLTFVGEPDNVIDAAERRKIQASAKKRWDSMYDISKRSDFIVQWTGVPFMNDGMTGLKALREPELDTSRRMRLEQETH